MDSTGYIEPGKGFDDPTGLINSFIDLIFLMIKIERTNYYD